MTSYRKLYAALVDAIDRALGHLGEDRPEAAARILQAALLDAEDQVCTLDIVPDTDPDPDPDTDTDLLPFPGRS